MGNELPVKVSVGLVDELSQKLDKIKNKFPEVQNVVSRVKNNFDFLQASTEGFRKSVEGFAEKVGPKLSSIGKSMTVGITLPVVAAAGYSVKKFMDIENALNEVQGATDLSGASLKAFGENIKKVSTQTTFSQEELLGLAQAAGEAGIRGAPNLEAFAVTLAKLQKTASGVGPEAAEALKEILTLGGDGVGSISNFGSAVTALENQYGVKTKSIIEMSNSIVREVGKFGLSSTQVAAFATAIQPLGFEAKNASAAIGEAFRGIDNAIRDGGIKMQGLQKITGMTGDELKKQFKDNPEVVFEAFLNGLNKIEQNGGQTTKALEFFGASGDKTGVILTALAKDTSKLSEMQKFARNEFEKNTALQDEYNDTTVTLSASLKKFKNNTDALAVTLGNQLAPVVMAAANAMSGLMKWFNEHPTISTMVAVLGGFLAILGPTLLVIGQVITMFGTAMKIINGLQAAWAVLTAVTWSSVAATLAAIGPYLLIGAAIVGLIAIIWKFRDAIWAGIVTAWDWVIQKIQQAIELLKTATAFMSKGFLKGTPLGAAAFVANKALNLVSPDKPATGALQTQAQNNNDFKMQTNNAKVDVFVRAPQSTSVVGESQGGVLNINRGLMGAF